MLKIFLMLSFLALSQLPGYSQTKDSAQIAKDSLAGKSIAKKQPIKKDTLAKKQYDPGRASLYSAVFPGLGQIYNKKYWKAPIVWAAVGIPVYTFFYNRQWYTKTRYALAVVANGSQGNADSLAKVDALLKQAVLIGDTQDLENWRNYFRKDEDYSILFFLLFYALNIVDATVDAHLKEFNVNSDLSLLIKPNLMGGNSAGLSFTLDIHKPAPRPLFDIR